MSILSEDYTLGGYVDFMQLARVHAKPYALPFVFYIFSGFESDGCGFDCITVAETHHQPTIQNVPYIGHITGCTNVVAANSKKLGVVSRGYSSNTIGEEWGPSIRLRGVGIVGKRCRRGFLRRVIRFVRVVCVCLRSFARRLRRRCRCWRRPLHFSRLSRRWWLWRSKISRRCGHVYCLCPPRRRHHLCTIVHCEREWPSLIERPSNGWFWWCWPL